MFEYEGNCQCGAVNLSFHCSKPLPQYQARACDCDYCLNKNIEYLSDPKGKITITSTVTLEQQKQGSEQARFLVCSNCHSTLAACYFDHQHVLGSVNATLLTNYASLQKSAVVSPKLLNKDEKVNRWRALWSELSIALLED